MLALPDASKGRIFGQDSTFPIGKEERGTTQKLCFSGAPPDQMRNAKQDCAEQQDRGRLGHLCVGDVRTNGGEIIAGARRKSERAKAPLVRQAPKGRQQKGRL